MSLNSDRGMAALTIEGEDEALQIINALAPLSRREEWWVTDGPMAVVAGELRRLYPRGHGEPNE